MRDISNQTIENSVFSNVNKNRGILIAYEGISGCGKSESIKKITGYLAANGYTAKVIEWNSNHTIRKLTGRLISKGMLTPVIYSILQWISFFIDYAAKIKPYLNQGHIVIADRYIYTGLTRDKVNRSKKKFKLWISRMVRKPDILFFFDTQPQICYERVMKRGKPLFYTNKRIYRSKLLKNKELYYLKKLRYEYLKLIHDPELMKDINVLIIENNFETLDQRICDYLKLKVG